MATVRVKFRASSVDMRKGALFYQIIHNRVVRQISTEYRLYEFEWDATEGRVVPKMAINKCRRNYLAVLDDEVKHGFSVLLEVISDFEQSGEAYSSDDIVARYAEVSHKEGFLSFIDQHIVHLRKVGKSSAVTKLNAALRSFKSFAGKDEISFEEVTSDLMEEYEGWLRRKGNCWNTVSFYIRQLRPVYGLAVERGLTKDIHPFKHVYSGIDKTVKRAVSIAVIRKIQALDLSKKPHLNRARDLFLFLLYTRGMSFVDMCNLKRTDLRDGVLTYRRQKTNQLLQIRWEKPMQQILDRLGNVGGTYLLPIIMSNRIDTRVQCENALRRLNRNLKKIGNMVGLDTKLTTYVARHTWASLAQSNNVPISVISKALGHDSETTTKIYLANLDTSVVDNANRKILNLLK